MVTKGRGLEQKVLIESPHKGQQSSEVKRAIPANVAYLQPPSLLPVFPRATVPL